MATPAIDKHVKRYKQFAYKAQAANDDGTFSGYASVFDNVDEGYEIVLPGAFSESLEKITASGDPLPVLWQHRSAEPVGGSDILREDEKGLYTEGYLLVKEVQRAAEAFAFMKRRIVKGLSIGYYPVEWSYNVDENILSHIKVDLIEYSIVTFPMNQLAEIDAVKAMCARGKLPDIREFEGFLREAGFSKTQAMHIANKGLRPLLDRGEPESVDGEILAALKAFSL